MPETANKFFSNKLVKQVGEKGSSGDGKGSSHKHPLQENNKGKDPLFGTSINLLSEDCSSESENAALGTKGTLPSPQQCDAPGVQLHRKAYVTDGDACGTSSRRPKRKVLDRDIDDSTSPAATANGSAEERFRWNYEDEMCLLSAMVRFTNMLGHRPKNSRHMDILYDMLVANLSFRHRSHLKKDKMIRQTWKMRSRYTTALQMLEDGRTLAPNEHALLEIGNQIWDAKAEKQQRKKKTGEKKDPGMVVDKVKEDIKGKISSSQSCPSHCISNGDVKVGNGISGAVNICDSDKAVDDSNILELLTQMLVLSGNHGLGYSRSYLQKKMSLLKSAERKALEDICNKLQEEERERDSRRLEASLKIIKIFKSTPSSSL